LRTVEKFVQCLNMLGRVQKIQVNNTLINIIEVFLSSTDTKQLTMVHVQLLNTNQVSWTFKVVQRVQTFTLCSTQTKTNLNVKKRFCYGSMWWTRNNKLHNKWCDRKVRRVLEYAAHKQKLYLYGCQGLSNIDPRRYTMVVMSLAVQFFKSLFLFACFGRSARVPAIALRRSSQR